jgi:alpha-beta hydrolase superfamily lysophospholipase
MTTRPVRFLATWAFRAALLVAIVLATIVVGAAIDARRRHPDLKPWHRVVLDDVRAAEMTDRFTFADYAAKEQQLFGQLRAFESALDPSERTPVNRYTPGSLSHPLSAGRDWNQSYESIPATITAGALLVHGLTDSPYSMRAIAGVLSDSGIYSLALRMPGHGTVPSGLVRATWQDWIAAVRVGVRHVKSRIPEGAPIILVGYSNGGALVAKYAIESLDHADMPKPARVVLLSPMIGVSPAAILARLIGRLGVVPYFEKANWLDVFPEYNPFKYNSFPANAGFQSGLITRAVQDDLDRAAAAGTLARLPPILTFQSIVDATVSTAAVVHALYDRIPANGSELVLFDVNHVAGVDAFMRPADRSLVEQLFDRAPRRYRRVLVTNASPSTRNVVAEIIEPDATDTTRRALPLEWPPQVFSLTHVALPFTPDDPLYGIQGPGIEAGLLPLGRLSPRGERSVLAIHSDTLMRLSSNPFFPLIAERLRGWLAISKEIAPP